MTVAAAERGPRPRRPRLVLVATGYLILTGVLGLLAAARLSSDLPPGNGTILLGTIGVGLASIAIGLVVFIGRVWLVCISYAALLGLLDLLTAASSPFGLVLGLADIAVVGILLTAKPWFDEMGTWRAPIRKPLGSGPGPSAS